MESSKRTCIISNLISFMCKIVSAVITTKGLIICLKANAHAQSDSSKAEYAVETKLTRNISAMLTLYIVKLLQQCSRKCANSSIALIGGLRKK
eukprot:11179558-Lingulodinium_polyedra.AAC.1